MTTAVFVDAMAHMMSLVGMCSGLRNGSINYLTGAFNIPKIPGFKNRLTVQSDISVPGGKCVGPGGGGVLFVLTNLLAISNFLPHVRRCTYLHALAGRVAALN